MMDSWIVLTCPLAWPCGSPSDWVVRTHRAAPTLLDRLRSIALRAHPVYMFARKNERGIPWYPLPDKHKEEPCQQRKPKSSSLTCSGRGAEGGDRVGVSTAASHHQGECRGAHAAESDIA